MKNFPYSFKMVIAFVMTLVLTVFASPNKTAEHTVLDEENCRLCVSVISDSHIEGNNFARYKVFRSILKDAKNISTGNDAVVYLGDNTMNGQEIESLLFYGAAAYEHVAARTIPVCGNHDVGNGEGDYNKLRDRFLGFCNAGFGLDSDKPYYYKIVNGYYFIVLGPEDLCVYECPVSDEQYKFLDDTLALATADGKPAFVCAHHPWNDIGDDWGERIESILTKYDNVFYISGHTHFWCCEGWTFNSDSGINEINLPRCTDLAGENDNEIYDGTGYTVQIEVYDTEVVGRVRNSYKGEWDDSLEYHFELTKAD